MKCRSVNFSLLIVPSALSFSNGRPKCDIKNARTAIPKNMFNGRQSFANARIVRDFILFVQGHVKIHADQRLFIFKRNHFQKILLDSEQALNTITLTQPRREGKNIAVLDYKTAILQHAQGVL